MSLLQLYNASKQYGSKLLFDGAQFSINPSEHIGVIGPNGAGKTTLFKIIFGTESLDSGEVIKTQNLRLGYLEQESHWNLQKIAEEHLRENCSVPIWNLKQIGKTIGLNEDHFASPLSSMSGGYQMRMKLLYLIGQEPDLMLLDEPTNFLDLESILALESFLQEFKGAFLLISHDREFLKRTTEYTLEVENQQIVKFPGNVDDYFEQKAEWKNLLQQQAANIENKRKHLQDFVDRFRAKATKARQAQSRMKQLEKLERIEISKSSATSRIKLPEPTITGKYSLHLKNANLGYGEKLILKNVTITFQRGERYGIVGQNGAGKSTLLKSLGDRIPLLEGQYELGHNVSLSYFAQHLSEDLSPEDTVLESLQQKADKSCLAQDILNIAGSLLFSGDDVHKKIKVLSGGEKTRVSLGQILLQKRPVLLMDEPTNHLDFDTVQSLAEALSHFSGTLIVVSHDRSFIKSVSTKILEIHNSRVELYPGSYEDYLWSLEKGALSERATASSSLQLLQTSPLVISTPAKLNFKDEQKRLTSEIKDLKRKISKSEEKISSMNQVVAELNQNLITANGLKAQELAKNASDVANQIYDIENQLLSDMEELEKKEIELKLLH